MITNSEKVVRDKEIEGMEDSSSMPSQKHDINFLEQRKSQKPNQIEINSANEYFYERYVVDSGYIHINTDKGLLPIVRAFDVLCSIRNLDDDTVSMKIGIDSFGKYKEVVIPFQDFTKVRFPKYITKYGSDITESNAETVIGYIIQEKDNVPQEFCHSGVGFAKFEKHFMFKHYDAINFPYASQYNGHFDLTPTGSTNEWLEMVNTQVLGNVLLELILVLGFSAPIFALLSSEVLIVHLWGDSSKGKTTSVRLGVSPFVKPAIDDDGGIITWNGTENALIETISNNQGIPLAFDEGSMHTGNLTRQIYKIASGAGRRRLNQDGSLRETGYWRNVIFSTAEHSLLEKASNNTGLKVRIIEIGNRYFTSSAKNAEAIEKTVLNNYALAGPIFVEKLMEIKDELDPTLASIREDLEGKINEKSPFTSRIVKKLALIVLTAKLVKRFLNINLNIEEIITLLLELESEKTQDIDIGKNAFEHFVEILNEYKHCFSQGDYEPSSKLWGRIEISKKDASRTVNILTHKFKEIMEKAGYESIQTILENWKEKGLLECEANRHSKKKTMISGHGQVRVYSIKFPRSLFPDEPTRKTMYPKKSSTIQKLLNSTDEEAIL